MRTRAFAVLLAATLILPLSACATGFPAQVRRFQAMPAPTGQSFAIEPAGGERAGLEFAQYADLVRRHLIALGYAEAPRREAASMIVTLDYGVDDGTERIAARPDPFRGYGLGGFDGRGYRYGFYRPYYSRFGYAGGYRSPFYWGWNDPFYGGYELDRYTVFESFVDLEIHSADGRPLFEGLAEARSRDDDLPELVPNLVEAMFTGFPGNSGERVRITVAPDGDRRD